MALTEAQKQYRRNYYDKHLSLSARGGVRRTGTPGRPLKYKTEEERENAGKKQRRDSAMRQRAKNPLKYLLIGVKQRAKKKNLPFNLTEDDLIVPTHCPVLGIPLEFSVGKKHHQNTSPTVDRIVPSKGYVKGNIIVISWRANRIKCDATIEELQKIAEFYKQYT